MLLPAVGVYVCLSVCPGSYPSVPSVPGACGSLCADARVLAASLTSLGYSIASGGTDIHLLLLDLRSTGMEGAGARGRESVGAAAISTNKNSGSGDKSALNPSVCLYCALTSCQRRDRTDEEDGWIHRRRYHSIVVSSQQ